MKPSVYGEVQTCIGTVPKLGIIMNDKKILTITYFKSKQHGYDNK